MTGAPTQHPTRYPETGQLRSLCSPHLLSGHCELPPDCLPLHSRHDVPPQGAQNGHKELRAEEREIQDGARTLRAAARSDRHADWGQDTKGRLARYARIPPPAQTTLKQGFDSGGSLLPAPDTEEEDSDMEAACSTKKVMQATRPKIRKGMGDTTSMQ